MGRPAPPARDALLEIGGRRELVRHRGRDVSQAGRELGLERVTHPGTPRAGGPGRGRAATSRSRSGNRAPARSPLGRDPRSSAGPARRAVAPASAAARRATRRSSRHRPDRRRVRTASTVRVCRRATCWWRKCDLARLATARVRYAPNADGSRSASSLAATRTKASCTRSSASDRSPVSMTAKRSAPGAWAR